MENSNFIGYNNTYYCNSDLDSIYVTEQYIIDRFGGFNLMS